MAATTACANALIQWYDDDDDVRQQQKTLITPLVHFHDVLQEEL